VSVHRLFTGCCCYGDPVEGAPEMLAAARAAGWQATLITLKR
jgi:hypothetical protein